MSEEQKQILSDLALERNKDPEYKARVSAGLDAVRQDPEYKQHLSEGVTKFHASEAGKIVNAHKSELAKIQKKEFYASEAGRIMKEHLRETTLKYMAEHGSPLKGKVAPNPESYKIGLNVAMQKRVTEGHPWLGKHHSAVTKEKLRRKRDEWFKTPEGILHKKHVGESITKYYADPEHRLKKSEQQIARLKSGELKPFRTKYGNRIDLDNEYYRSTTEANYARILRYTNVKYVYESSFFRFKDGTSYTPDFYLPETDEYIEIKGFYSDKDRLKYDKFKAEYPDVKWRIILQASREWIDLRNKYRPLIPTWEGVK
jgi:hypothetical protein